MSPTTPARRFTREDVHKWLDEKTLAQADSYVAAVSQLHVSDVEVSALVQGADRRPYTVRILFQPGRRGGTQVNMHCTCPVGHFCKHCGAVLLAAIAQRGEMVLQPDPLVLDWVKKLRTQLTAPAASNAARGREQLFYVLDHVAQTGAVSVTMRKARPLADGGLPEGAEPWNGIERALQNPPAFITADDQTILRLLWVARDRDDYSIGVNLRARPVDDLLPRLLATGRCLFGERSLRPLHNGSRRMGSISWLSGEDGLTRVAVSLDGVAQLTVLPTDPPWYVLPDMGEAGPLDLGMDTQLAASLLAAPPLRPVDVALVARELGELLPELPRPDTRGTAKLRTLRATPKLRLRLASQIVETVQRWRAYPALYREWLDFVRPVFDYGGVEVSPDDMREFRLLGKETVRLARDTKAEAVALQNLATLGFERLPDGLFHSWAAPQEKCLYALSGEAAWADWLGRIAPALRGAGWSLEVDRSFRHYVVDTDELFAEVEARGADWFEVSLGIELEGQRVALAPLLAGLLHEQPRLIEPGVLDQLPDDSAWIGQLDDGRRVRIRMGRLKPVLRTFIDLFDGTEKLKVSRLDAPRLESLTRLADVSGLQAVHAARERLAELATRPLAQAPAGLGVQLRPYQLEGLAWLQALRELGLGGILADDMGLGKTAQTLAHLLTEKIAGRLDKPALVVLPTSLVFNWRREAAVVAPDLSVYALHGPQRDFSIIDKYDVVLTTYPLIWRDADELKQHEFHILILDEAQTVKNASSKAAAVVREIRARHRLCLTGTPMENHLGELWAQFDFLLPGFLGSDRDFQRNWRTPIEKGGDGLRRELLARRIKPFILRRRKDDVARDLPPRNVMVRSIELSGDQRDLYETVRAAMDEKVRDEVAAKGANRSQIVILDALLKLRQVCCDPRLVALESAKLVKQHAKLDFLMEMLPELIAEGRRVLVFSQFASMLDLIGEALDKAALPYLLLTGQTQDREAVVSRFQAGEVPLFLISLKAGGVGLNLTAADTVIHFDPWWNPAAENQATDRAHRIGQTRPVFVYKLVAAGSIEERIVALQERKAALAAAVLTGDADTELRFTEEDLAALFAPLS